MMNLISPILVTILTASATELPIKFDHEMYAAYAAESVSFYHTNLNSHENYVETNIIKEIWINPDIITGSISSPLMDNKPANEVQFFVKDVTEILYLGDDYGVPVLGLSIIDIEFRKTEKTETYAFMVRSPKPYDSSDQGDFFRPRWRGDEAISLYRELRQADPDRPSLEILKQIPFEYKSIQLKFCRSAYATHKRMSKLKFLPEDKDSFLLHADEIQLHFSSGTGLRKSAYNGWVEENTPAGWASDLIDALDECW